MSHQWLAIQSFQQGQNLLDAINTLSIHLKLQLAGIPDEEREQASHRARELLASFLEKLQEVVYKTEQVKATPIFGVDSRMKQLAKNFVAAKDNRRKFRSALFTKDIDHVLQLLSSTQEKDEKELIESLVELRVLIQEHIHGDAGRILGEV